MREKVTSSRRRRTGSGGDIWVKETRLYRGPTEKKDPLPLLLGKLSLFQKENSPLLLLGGNLRPIGGEGVLLYNPEIKGRGGGGFYFIERLNKREVLFEEKFRRSISSRESR